jgi:hypothetical protein
MGVREKYSHYIVPDTVYLNELSDILVSFGFDDIVII